MMITKAAVILLLWAFALPACVNAEVLIVADEFPAMEALAARLKAERGHRRKSDRSGWNAGIIKRVSSRSDLHRQRARAGGGARVH